MTLIKVELNADYWRLTHPTDPDDLRHMREYGVIKSQSDDDLEPMAKDLNEKFFQLASSNPDWRTITFSNVNDIVKDYCYQGYMENGAHFLDTAAKLLCVIYDLSEKEREEAYKQWRDFK